MRCRPMFGLVLGIGSLLSAADFPPLAPEVWAIKEDPARGIRDAVVLEKRVQFRNTYIDYTFKVRILTERGRKAAEFREFSDQCYDFKGRVVHRDGKIVPLDKRKDFELQTISARGDEASWKAMVMPGVTSDCVAELSWRESARPLPIGSSSFMRWQLDSDWFTLLSAVEIPASFPMTTQFLVPANVRRDSRNGSNNVHTYFDLPAVPDEPFGYTTPSRAMLYVYEQPSGLAKYAYNRESDVYWKVASSMVFGPFLDGDRGRKFRKFSAELLAGVAGTPQEQAREIAFRLDQRIRNLDSLTSLERAAQANNRERPSLTDLDAAVASGEASGLGMTLLLLHLLRDKGLNPHVAFVTDRDHGIYYHELLSVWQWSDIVLGVEEPGKETLWLDPSLRFGAPGLIYPNYQGVPCLLMEGGTKALKRSMLPIQPESSNLRRFDFVIEPGEEGAAFQVHAQFFGTPAYNEKGRFKLVESDEQIRRLKEGLEKDVKGMVVAKAEVLNARAPREPFGWKAEGTLPMEGSRRLQVSPFPGMPWPITVPSSYPENRQSRILIPYARIHQASSTVTIPAGYAALPVQPVEFRNPFGTIHWKAEATAEGKMLISLKVSITKVTGMPGDQGYLRSFLGAMEEALRRTLVLERKG